uniref:Uncharacterized protein n=1 Tax=Anguilla anguilla TaxID=7936 RepID=A0A0E9RM69_ANGAN
MCSATAWKWSNFTVLKEGHGKAEISQDTKAVRPKSNST